jgi:hypothetical protein
MHKGAILDVHFVRSLRIAIHAGLAADSRERSAVRLRAGSDGRDDPAVTHKPFDLLVFLRTIWSSAGCGGQWSPRVKLVSRRVQIRAVSPMARIRNRTRIADRSGDCSTRRRLRVR